MEKERVGGTCLNVGCIPTKALTTSAELLLDARRAREFGLSIPEAAADLPGLMQYKGATVDRLVAGVEQLLRARRVTLVRGSARLQSPDTLAVDDGRGTRTITAAHVILAPGSIPAEPPIEGRDLPGVISSTQALDIQSIPARLVVVGGGVIGLEFACIYEALGSHVTVLEMATAVLAGATEEVLAERLALLLRRRGMVIETGRTVQRITRAGDSLKVQTVGATGESTVVGDRVLLATGRWPNTAGFGLEALGLEMRGRAISADEWMATSVPKVWAVGDAVGGWMLAHKAMVEGRIAAENATGGERPVDYRSVPNVVFTRPELASVGFTERQARAVGPR
ncbi:dihydrolipoyl dehydrogenase [Anaeromyxobacter sp. PSR-1]|nr:dihydrolipoyl dehydrogenase [Anaeromyxobacter sp. PSR-1]